MSHHLGHFPRCPLDGSVAVFDAVERRELQSEIEPLSLGLPVKILVATLSEF
jgi:hypothetical protein